MCLPVVHARAYLPVLLPVNSSRRCSERRGPFRRDPSSAGSARVGLARSGAYMPPLLEGCLHKGPPTASFLQSLLISNNVALNIVKYNCVVAVGSRPASCLAADAGRAAGTRRASGRRGEAVNRQGGAT